MFNKIIILQICPSSNVFPYDITVDRSGPSANSVDLESIKYMEINNTVVSNLKGEPKVIIFQCSPAF
jgi:hypothetical protein